MFASCYSGLANPCNYIHNYVVSNQSKFLRISTPLAESGEYVHVKGVHLPEHNNKKKLWIR